MTTEPTDAPLPPAQDPPRAALPARSTRRRPRRRTRRVLLGLADLRDAAAAVGSVALALAAAAWLQPSLGIERWWTPFAVAALVGLGDLVVRPLLRPLAGVVGPLLTLVLGVLWQVALVWGALTVVPGITVADLGAVPVTLLLVGVVSVLAHWLVSVNDSSYLLDDVLARARSRRRRSRRETVGDATPPGVVVVQIDGLPFPLLEHGVVTGTLPTLARWMRSGSHTPRWWWASVPATTPSGQAGLLHGSNADIPAFRWYEKESGRLVVANRPADAALVEERHSDGRGLLAGGGVSVSNLFTGDAETSLLVMSRAGRRRGLGPGGDYVRFFARPFVFTRALVLTVGEMVKEVWQGHQQRVRRIEPRVQRKGAYVVLRGVTNALLRDLNVALVAEHMMRGAPVIYVDFLDYDEVAHHAGVARPESLDALMGVDRVLGTLEQAAAAADRHYEFVVVSDHGQSQGATFLQLNGIGLEESIRLHTGTAASQTFGSTHDAETWGPLNALLSDVLGSNRATSRMADRKDRDGAGVVLGPSRYGRDAGSPGTTADDVRPEVAVVGSGNLGLVWWPRMPGRLTLEDLRERFPRLVTGLLGQRGVGFLLAESTRGPIAVGRTGVHVLKTGEVEGGDPLEPFGPRAVRDLLRLSGMDHAPDLLVHSSVHPLTQEVHAFEELVGCHGGLGGWQNYPVLVHPSGWTLDDDLLDRSVPGEEVLVGADAVHRQLVRWLERIGTRARPGTPV